MATVVQHAHAIGSSQGSTVHHKLKRDIQWLRHLIIVSTNTDLDNVKLKLQSFKKHFDVHTNNGRQWKKDETTNMLQDSGVFQHIGALLGHIVTLTCPVDMTMTTDLCSLILNILGNYFSIPQSQPVSIADEWELRLLEILRLILSTDKFTCDTQITNRTLRLLANIIKNRRPNQDPQVSLATRKGLLEAVLQMIENPPNQSAKLEEAESVYKSLLRCIRACVAKSDGKTRMNAIGGVKILVVSLTSEKNLVSEPFVMDILEIVHILISPKLSAVPREEVVRLGLHCHEVFKTILYFYTNSSPKSKIYDVTTNIIRSLMTSEILAETLLKCDFLKAITLKLKSTEDPAILRHDLEILHCVTEGQRKWPSLNNACYGRDFNHLCGSAIKILRIFELGKFHLMILYMCSHMSSGGKEHAIDNGLLEAVGELLSDKTTVHDYCDVERLVATIAANHSSADSSTTIRSPLLPQTLSCSTTCLRDEDIVLELLRMASLFIMTMRPVKAQLSGLMPVFIGLFIDHSVHSDAISSSTFNPNSTTPTHDSILFHLTEIIVNLCFDQELFWVLIEHHVPSLLRKIQFVAENSSRFSNNITNFFSILKRRQGSQEPKLIKSLKSSEASTEQQIAAALSLPVLFHNSTSRRRWVSPCSTLLLKVLDESKEESGDSEKVIISLLEIGRSDEVDLNWRIKVQAESDHLGMDTTPCQSLALTDPSEITFCVEVKNQLEIHVGSELLKISPVFEAMLAGSFVEATERRIDLSEYSRDGFLTFLKHATSHSCSKCQGTEPLSMEILFEIIFLSHQYLVEEVYKKSTRVLLGLVLRPDTFIEIYTELAQFPDLPCEVAAPYGFNLRTLVLLYFLVTDDIPSMMKVMQFKDLIGNHNNAPLVRKDLREIFDYNIPFKNRKY